MKLKDLLCNREKLRKYDELKDAREFFSKIDLNIPIKFNIDGAHEITIAPSIIEIILSALDAEIKKLDEE